MLSLLNCQIPSSRVETEGRTREAGLRLATTTHPYSEPWKAKEMAYEIMTTWAPLQRVIQCVRRSLGTRFSREGRGLASQGKEEPTSRAWRGNCNGAEAAMRAAFQRLGSCPLLQSQVHQLFAEWATMSSFRNNRRRCEGPGQDPEWGHSAVRGRQGAMTGES